MTEHALATSSSLPAHRGDSSLDREEFEYRPLPTSAVAAVVLGILSVTIFFAGRDDFSSALMLAPLPLAGLALAFRSLSQIQSSDGHLGGRRIALVGAILSALCLVGGLGYAGFVRATEVPDGYAATSFVALAPDETDLRAGRPVPEAILNLDGKRVFIKGYMRPDSTPVSKNVQRFLLVRDSNTCCFGDLSSVKYYDQIGVKVGAGLKVDQRLGLFRVGGTLHVRPQHAKGSRQELVFALDADYAE